MSEAVVTVTGLGKSYPLAQNLAGKEKKKFSLPRLIGSRQSEENIHWALKDVSFSVNRGERIGIVGRNGAGKSTLLKIMSRVTYPTTGEIRIKGTLTSLLEVGTGFNDNLSGRENVFLNASLYGLSRERTRERFDEIVEFSGVSRFIDTPLKHYSSGMRMRLAFSVAAHLDPDILLLDEVLAVGDMAFQRKCLERVDDLTSRGQTLFFVSHSMDSVMRYCDRCLWIENGQLLKDGDAGEVIEAYVEAVLNVKSSLVRPTLTDAEGNPASSERSPVVAAEDRHENVGDGTPENSGNAHLMSARIIDEAGEDKTLFHLNEKIGIEMIYSTTGSNTFIPGIHVYCPLGTHIFNAVPTGYDIAHYAKDRPTVIRSVVWVPKHLLNIGTYSVSLMVFNPFDSPFRRFFQHERMLSFHCVEAPLGEVSARGGMPRPFPGPIRPMLDWTVEDQRQ